MGAKAVKYDVLYEKENSLTSNLDNVLWQSLIWDERHAPTHAQQGAY